MLRARQPQQPRGGRKLEVLVDDVTWIAHDSVLGELQYLFLVVLLFLVCRQALRVIKARAVESQRSSIPGANAAAR